MARLEDLTTGTRLTGLAASGSATVESARWIGDQALKVIYRDGEGQLSERLLYRDDEPSLELVEMGRPWSFDGDGGLLRLVSEAYRINLAWLFDPYVAITTSIIEPLPHQISAVYEEMLPRQPMRFLLADDPGAGKTIMAGLLIKELKIRGDLERCLIITPGSLTDQWQDELAEKFGLNFEILTARHDSCGAHRQPVRPQEFLDRPHGSALPERKHSGEAESRAGVGSRGLSTRPTA